jgi:hypothetical protein
MMVPAQPGVMKTSILLAIVSLSIKNYQLVYGGCRMITFKVCGSWHFPALVQPLENLAWFARINFVNFLNVIWMMHLKYQC